MLPTFKKQKNTIFTYRIQFVAVIFFLLCAFKPNFAQSRNDKVLNNTNFKLVSWNIQDLGQSKSNEEIAFMADVLKDFDMVAIQEVVAKHPAGAQKVAELA